MNTAAQMLNDDEPISKTRLRVWLRLLRASRLIEDDLRRRLREENNWTLSRFDLMAALYRSEGGLKMSEISKRLMISNGNVTAIVDKLTSEGLAERLQMPGDRRAHLVQLTNTGREQFAEYAATHETWVSELLETLGPQESADLLQKLEDMIDFLEAR